MRVADELTKRTNASTGSLPVIDFLKSLKSPSQAKPAFHVDYVEWGKRFHTLEPRLLQNTDAALLGLDLGEAGDLLLPLLPISEEARYQYLAGLHGQDSRALRMIDYRGSPAHFAQEVAHEISKRGPRALTSLFDQILSRAEQPIHVTLAPALLRTDPERWLTRYQHIARRLQKHPLDSEVREIARGLLEDTAPLGARERGLFIKEVFGSNHPIVGRVAVEGTPQLFASSLLSEINKHGNPSDGANLAQKLFLYLREHHFPQ